MNEGGNRIWRNTLPIRVINDWNALPPHVVQANSMTQCKSQLDMHWQKFQYYVTAQDLA